MATLTDAERAFLSQDWRWAEISDSAIKVRHPGAREADRSSPMMTEAGAVAVLTPIHNLISADNRLVTCVVDGLLSVSFKQRPPTVTLITNRYGFGAGRKMICERADRIWGERQTILYLYG